MYAGLVSKSAGHHREDLAASIHNTQPIEAGPVRPERCLYAPLQAATSKRRTRAAGPCSSLEWPLENHHDLLGIRAVVGHERADNLVERVAELPLHALTHVEHARLAPVPLQSES